LLWRANPLLTSANSRRSAAAMIRIAISQAAFEAICTTLPLGSVAYEPEANSKASV
jgi:hypothetical protein